MGVHEERLTKSCRKNQMIQKTIFGKPIEGAYKRYLSEQEKKPDKEKEIIIPPTEIQNPEKYLILKGRTHSKYSYPDIGVAVERTHHDKDWYQAHEALHHEGSFMLTIRQFVDFLSLLKSGKAYYASGDKAGTQTLNSILDEILAVREPWRLEWLDADFKVINNTLHINYNHKLTNNQLQPQYSEPLEDCLTQNKLPGIGLNYWLRNATSQGLPPVKTPNGDLWYWAPASNNSVAGFVSDAGAAWLYCCREPSGSDSSIGVRQAKILQRK